MPGCRLVFRKSPYRFFEIDRADEVAGGGGEGGVRWVTGGAMGRKSALEWPVGYSERSVLHSRDRSHSNLKT